jgi:hypothetical protein
MEKNEIGCACSTYGESKGEYRVLVVKPERKKPLKDPGIDGRYIKIDVQEVECVGMDWINVAQDRDRWWALVNVVMKLQVP